MTITMKEAATKFLSKKRIAVAGVSREGGFHGGNPVYQRLRDRGYDVFAVNPNAHEVEGDSAYPNLRTIPGGVEAVVIATHPKVSPDVMQECIDLGIKNVWMHRGIGGGSVSHEAAEMGRSAGLRVIEGGCPLMYEPTADFGHKAIRGVLSVVGKIPKQV